MKSFYFFVFLLSAFFTVLIAHFAYGYYSPENPLNIHPVGRIELPIDGTVHFLDTGIAVSSEYTEFFNPSGKRIDPPISPEDFVRLPLAFSFNETKGSLALIGNSYIYDTSYTPFKLLFAAPESNIAHFKSFPEHLLIVKDIGGRLTPNLFKLDTQVIAPFSHFDNIHYLNSSFSDATPNFTLLTISTDGTVPSTEVFHYSESDSLTGAFRLRDRVYLGIERIGNFVVMFGANHIACYNLLGESVWEIYVPNAYEATFIKRLNDLVIYFPESVEGSHNSYLVSKSGELSPFLLPPSLSSVQSFDDGFIALRENREIVIFDTFGELSARFELGNFFERLIWDSRFPKFVYLKDQFNALQIFALEKIER